MCQGHVREEAFRFWARASAICRFGGLPEAAHAVLEALPLVWLPLALYVRSTMHLYEMLERLQARVAGGASLRLLLDRDERCYSYLVFAVVAALQTLHLTRNRMQRRFPLALFGSSPPRSDGQANRYPMAAWWPTRQLVFRGIWVGPEVDEERARFQYSFQSFSRDIPGMNKVLCFYAGARGSRPAGLAVTDNHVLVYVVRVLWAVPGCLAMPVQLFDGPRRRRSELEVLFPPYVRYELEDDLSMSSEDFSVSGPLPRASERLAALQARWQGFELPDDLLRMLRRAPYAEEFEELELLRPFITVRFIRAVELPEPLSRFFVDPALQLYRLGL